MMKINGEIALLIILGFVLSVFGFVYTLFVKVKNIIKLTFNVLTIIG